MSVRVDSSPLIAGSVVIGDPGHGVLGSEVPTTGLNGGGILKDDVASYQSNEVRCYITTWPTLGKLTVFEDSSFIYEGPDGTHTLEYQLYVDGVATGPVKSVDIVIGDSSASADLAEALDSAVLSATGDVVTPITGGVSIALGESSVSGAGSTTNEVTGTLNETLGHAAGASTAASFIEGIASASLDAISMAASGSSFGAITAVLDETLGLVTASADGDLDIHAALSAGLGVLQVSAGADSEIVGELMAALANSDAAGSADQSSDISGNLDIQLASIGIRASAVGPFSAESALYFRGKLTATITFRGSLTSDLVFRSKLN
jgi:hypothetical protein